MDSDSVAQVPNPEVFPSLAEDLHDASAELSVTEQKLVRLFFALQKCEEEQAEKLCKSLEWERSDKPALKRMRKDLR